MQFNANAEEKYTVKGSLQLTEMLGRDHLKLVLLPCFALQDLSINLTIEPL